MQSRVPLGPGKFHVVVLVLLQLPDCPWVCCFLVQIKAIVLHSSAGLTNLNNKAKPNSGSCSQISLSCNCPIDESCRLHAQFRLQTKRNDLLRHNCLICVFMEGSLWSTEWRILLDVFILHILRVVFFCANVNFFLFQIWAKTITFNLNQTVQSAFIKWNYPGYIDSIFLGGCHRLPTEEGEILTRDLLPFEQKLLPLFQVICITELEMFFKLCIKHASLHCRARQDYKPKITRTTGFDKPSSHY